MNNKDLISSSFKSFRDRVDDLLKFYDKNVINFETLEINLREDLQDLEDTIKIIFDRLQG